MIEQINKSPTLYDDDFTYVVEVSSQTFISLSTTIIDLLFNPVFIVLNIVILINTKAYFHVYQTDKKPIL